MAKIKIGTILPFGNKIVQSDHFGHIECDQEYHYREDYNKAIRSNIGTCNCGR